MNTTAFFITFFFGFAITLLIAYGVCKTGKKEYPKPPHKFNHIVPMAMDFRGVKFISVFDLENQSLGKIYEHSCKMHNALITSKEAEEISYIQMNFTKVFEEL